MSTVNNLETEMVSLTTTAEKSNVCIPKVQPEFISIKRQSQIVFCTSPNLPKEIYFKHISVRNNIVFIKQIHIKFVKKDSTSEKISKAATAFFNFVEDNRWVILAAFIFAIGIALTVRGNDALEGVPKIFKPFLSVGFFASGVYLFGLSCLKIRKVAQKAIIKLPPVSI